MVVQSGSDSRAYVPRAPLRVVVAGDGTLAAIYDPPRCVVVEIPSCAVCADIDIDSAADRCDIVWVGPPARLVVLARYASHSIVHLIHPYGPRTIAEIRLETPMHLLASVGTYALATGPIGTAVLTAGEAHLTPYQFPARTVPIAAGSAAGQFVVALSASIEEWDPQARMPKRRLRLPGPTVISALGGSERVVWMTAQQSPTQIDVFALVNRGQPKRHQLPEPIAHVSGHPRSDLLVCRGADTGKLYVVDLDGKSALQTIDSSTGSPVAVQGIPSDGIGDAGDSSNVLPAGRAFTACAGLVVGRSVWVLAAQENRPIALVPLGRRDVEPQNMPPSTMSIPPPPTNGHSKRSTLYGDDDTGSDEADQGLPGKTSRDATEDAVDSERLTASLAQRISTLNDLVSFGSPQRVDSPKNFVSGTLRHSSLATGSGAAWRSLPRDDSSETSEVFVDGRGGQRATWRDALVVWTRSVGEGGLVPRCPDVQAISSTVERFALSPELVPAISLLYGEHLRGRHGAAPVDVAHVIGRNWDEALGKGQLRAEGIALFEASRVCLAPCVLRVLDGLQPQTGTLVGESGSVQVLGPCVVVSPTDDVVAVAKTCISTVGGAILASNDPLVGPEFVLEARAYGAVPMARLAAVERIGVSNGRPLIVVVADEASVEATGLPRLA